jgi:hypothetical protein
MSFHGLQTIDFLERLQKLEAEFPPLIREMAGLVQRLIEEIENPKLEDILRMQGELRRLIVDSQGLEEVCGLEGKLCGRCPFGAYLPTGFSFASPEQPLCLPWIVMKHPELQAKRS